MDPTENTLEIASKILIAALEAKSINLLPDPRVRQSTAEHDSAQIARAFAVVHEAVHNEQQRIRGRK